MALRRPLRAAASAAGRWHRGDAAQLGVRNLAGASRSYDVIIIGGGVIGNACALELRKKGFTTLNVDKGPSPGYGSTSSSSAVIRNFYSLEESCRMAWEGYHDWASWADYLQAPPNEELCQYREVGCALLDVPVSPGCQAFISRVRNATSACGIPVEEWDAVELKRRLPYLSMTSYFPPRRSDDEQFGEENGSSIAGALFCAQSGYASDPQLAARNLADAVLRQGGAFRWNSPVVSIDLDPTNTRVQGITMADRSTIEAPIVINAAGPHSAGMHSLAFQGANVEDDTRIHSQPLKVEVAYVNEPPGSNLDETCPVISDIDSGCYYRPQLGGQLLIGSIEPECDELEFLATPEDLNGSLTDEWTNLVYRAALRFPELAVPNTATGLTALYDTTPDWVPIYDRSALGGFYSMRGTSGNQFKNATVAGRICAKLVDGCENGYDHDSQPFSLKLENVQGALNLGLFSRLRSRQDTSNSVLG